VSEAARQHSDSPKTYRIAVRPLRLRDLDAVMRIASESPEAAAWSRESYEKLLEQREAVALVAEGMESFERATEPQAEPAEGRNGKHPALVGFLVGRVMGAEAEILNLAVALQHRRQGYAAALLSAAIKAFESDGAEFAYLEVRQSNTAGIAFYERHGFERTGLRKAYYHDPDEPAVTMSKHIRASQQP